MGVRHTCSMRSLAIARLDAARLSFSLLLIPLLQWSEEAGFTGEEKACYVVHTSCSFECTTYSQKRAGKRTERPASDWPNVYDASWPRKKSWPHIIDKSPRNTTILICVWVIVSVIFVCVVKGRLVSLALVGDDFMQFSILEHSLPVLWQSTYLSKDGQPIDEVVVNAWTKAHLNRSTDLRTVCV